MNTMVACITWIQSTLAHGQNFNYYCQSQRFELCHIFNQSIGYLYVMNLSYILLMRQQLIIFSAFASRPISLQKSIRAFVFLFMICMLPPSSFPSSAKTSRWCIHLNIVKLPQCLVTNMWQCKYNKIWGLDRKSFFPMAAVLGKKDCKKRTFCCCFTNQCEAHNYGSQL